MLKPSVEAYQTFFESLEANEVQQQAFAEFTRQGFPTRKNEKWKYTSLNTLLNTEFNFDLNHSDNPNVARLVGEDVAQLAHDNVARLVGEAKQPRKGISFPQHSMSFPYPIGVEHRLRRESFPLLAKTFGKTETIHITENQEQPIMLWHPLADHEAKALYRSIRITENASATIILNFESEDDTSCFGNIYTEIHLEPGAKLNIYKQQQLNTHSFLFDHCTITQAENSHFSQFTLDQGGAIARTDIDAYLVGKHASCKLYGYYHPKNASHIDNYSCITHYAGFCQSKQFYKGIMEDKSHAVFNGKVIFAKDAQKSETEQLNPNLLLSKHAEIDTKPELEIYADDVKASHGATVGQLDQNALFYLQARGLNHEQAKALLIEGFAKEVFDEIEDPVIKDMLLHSANLAGE